MQSSQASGAGLGTAGAGGSSSTSTRGAVAPRARAKKPAAPDPSQPTLLQVFARAAAKPPAGTEAAAATSTAAVPAPPSAAAPASKLPPPTATRPVAPPASRPEVISCCSSPEAAPPVSPRSPPRSTAANTTAATSAPWSVEREVLSLRRRPDAAAAAANTATATSANASSCTAAQLLGCGGDAAARGLRFTLAAGPNSSCSPLAGGRPSVPPPAWAPETAATSHHEMTTAAAAGRSSLHGPPSAVEPATTAAPAGAPAGAPAAANDSDSEVEVLAVRMVRLGIRSKVHHPPSSTAAAPVAAASAATSSRPGGGADTLDTRPPFQPPPQAPQQPYQAFTSPSRSRNAVAAAVIPGMAATVSLSAPGEERSAVAVQPPPPPPSAACEDLRRCLTADGGREAAGLTSLDAVAVWSAVPPPAEEGSLPAEGRKSLARRRGGGAVTTSDVTADGDGAAAAKPAGRGGRAGKAKAVPAARSGKAAGGVLLWTELTAEERAAAGGRCWIRWEPLLATPDGDGDSGGGGGGGGGSAPIFHLFSVDIETVDFMRGRQAFPRPDQVRLLEVAAVDLGPFQHAGPWVGGGRTGGGGGGGGGGHVFSTLVNCERSFKAHKTILHNGITWAESSAPGVPYTAEALQRLFGFIAQRCAAAATAAAASSSAAATSTGGAARVIPVLMAHNGAAFDFPVLRSECGRVGVEWPQDWWYFDTLAAARVLWAKADWPIKPADGAADEADGEGEDEGGQTAGNGAGGGKRSLSMDALKLWAGVVSAGQAHRALVDAEDLAAVWAQLYERWGRPSLTHLERLCSARGAAKSAAGPLHRLGLLSLAARADGLVRHVEAAVTAVLRPASSSASTASSSQPPQPSGGVAPPPPLPLAVMALSPAQLRQLAESNRLHLRMPRSGMDGSFWTLQVLGERPAAPLEGQAGGEVGDDDGEEEEEGEQEAASAGGGGEPTVKPTAAVAPPPPAQPSLVPFVVLLRGVKLRYMTRASYGYKPDHSPKWDMTLAAAGSGKAGSGGEGATSQEEVSELVTLLDNLAQHAAVQARGDVGRRARLYSCGKEDAKSGKSKMAVTAQLHAQLCRGPARGQLRWEPLASLATYDKKTASYKLLSWPPLESYVPAAAAGAWGGGDVELERIKEDNLARVVAQLPDVASNEVLDVAVWPEFCWVNNAGCGVRLKAVHLVRRAGR